MDVQITRSNDIFKYNPSLDGYTDGAFFKKTEGAGTPTITNEKLVLNNCSISSMDAFRNCNLEMFISFPSSPTSGQSKSIGLRVGNSPVGAFALQIDGAEAAALLLDYSGNLISSKPIIWDDDWTNNSCKFRLSITERNAYMAINDVIVARFEDWQDIPSSTKMSVAPREIFIENGNSDDLQISIVTVY